MNKEFFIGRLRELGYQGPTDFILNMLATAAQEAAQEQIRKDAEICQDQEDIERDGLNVAAYRNACQDLTVKILAQLPPTKTD